MQGENAGLDDHLFFYLCRFQVKSENLDYIDSELAYGRLLHPWVTRHTSGIDPDVRSTAQLSMTAENGHFQI